MSSESSRLVYIVKNDIFNWEIRQTFASFRILRSAIFQTLVWRKTQQRPKRSYLKYQDCEWDSVAVTCQFSCCQRCKYPRHWAVEWRCEEPRLGLNHLNDGTDGRRVPLKDEEHPENDPHLVPDFPRLCSRMFPERFRSASVPVGSKEIRPI